VHEGIDRLLAEAVAAGIVPGVVAMSADRQGVIYEGAFGRRVLPDGPAMTCDSVFWIASMTKAITTVAAMQLVEQGRIALDAPAGAIMPELAAPMVLEGFDARGEPVLRPARGTITLRGLLTHTAGLGYENWNPDIRRYAALRGIPGTASGRMAAFALPLATDPGTRWEYSIAIDWVGRIVEKASGIPFAEYLRTQILTPLGMHDTSHHLQPGQAERLAVVHRRATDGTLHAVGREPPDLPDFTPGGGGLLSTAADYTNFLRMLLNGGTLGGAAILQPRTVALMAENHIGPLPNAGTLRTADPFMSHDFVPFSGIPTGWGLGFLINRADLATGRRAGSLGWGGVANCYYWLDPMSGVAGLLLAQILPFADPDVLRLFAAFETEVYRS
jgi:methyl acetate hydrolase